MSSSVKGLVERIISVEVGSLAGAHARANRGSSHGSTLLKGRDHTGLLLLGVHLSLLKTDPFEPSRGDALKDESPDETKGTDGGAVGVLLPSERDSAHVATTVLNDNILDGEGADQDDDEHPVVEELSKHVILSLAQLARVDLVEELHEDEGLEDDGVNLNLTSGLLQHPRGLLGVSVELLLGRVEGPALLVLNSEDISAFEHKDEKNDDLEDRLSKDVSPHDGVDDGIILLLGLTVEDLLSIRRLSSEGKGGEGVHNQVNPEHLSGSERRLAE